MRLPNWLANILTCLRVLDASSSYTEEEMQAMIERILREDKLRWSFNHPNEEYLGMTAKEITCALEERMFTK